MQPKFLKFGDTYINVNVIKKIKYTRSGAGIYTYCIYLTDNSKEEFSYPIGRGPVERAEYEAFQNWLNSCILSYNTTNI